MSSSGFDHHDEAEGVSLEPEYRPLTATVCLSADGDLAVLGQAWDTDAQQYVPYSASDELTGYIHDIRNHWMRDVAGVGRGIEVSVKITVYRSHWKPRSDF